MIGRIFRSTGSASWDDQIAENTEMFAEADRLEASAYKIIQDGGGSAADWSRFTEAKKIADAQRTAAYQDWMRIKRQMRK
ncbi:hypothetical protein [Pseudomonas prosekii]|uniref:hypothetical protein n=1 Tax=Pseudomonas prosekii TaxID=1148509 RepID=UPI003F7539A9